MEISPWNSFDVIKLNINNISSELNCYKSLEEEIFKIHERTQPFNVQFINEVSLNLFRNHECIRFILDQNFSFPKIGYLVI